MANGRKRPKDIQTATVSLSALSTESDEYSQMCKCMQVSNIHSQLHACHCESPAGQPADVDTLTSICGWHAGLPQEMLTSSVERSAEVP